MYYISQVYNLLFQIIIGIIFFGRLSKSSNGSNFLFVDDWRMGRHQYSADENKINRTKTDHGESVKNK